MRRVLIITLSALMLAGCIAQWPSNRTGPRFHEGPGLSPYYDGGGTPSNTAPPPSGTSH